MIKCLVKSGNFTEIRMTVIEILKYVRDCFMCHRVDLCNASEEIHSEHC